MLPVWHLEETANILSPNPQALKQSRSNFDPSFNGFLTLVKFLFRRDARSARVEWKSGDGSRRVACAGRTARSWASGARATRHQLRFPVSSHRLWFLGSRKKETGGEEELHREWQVGELVGFSVRSGARP